MALTCTDLNATGCDMPDCGHDHSTRVIRLVAVCHRDAGSNVSYDKTTGTVTMHCAMCGNFLAEIAVAAGTLH